MHGYTPTTGTLAESCDVVRITAETRDEALDPEECVALVVEAEVGGWGVKSTGFVEEVGTSENTEPVQAVAVL